MAGISPLQLFIIPFVFLFALPLAVFAGVTTVLAFFVLYFRLTVAYFDVGLETIRFLVLGNSAGAYNSNNRRLVVVGESIGAAATTTTSTGSALSSLRASRASSPEGRRRSINSNGNGNGNGKQRRGSLTPSSAAPSAGYDRDFEGIGGWRIDGKRPGSENGQRGDGGVDDDDDDEQWYNLNSRLELPDPRHHVRSRSGGAVTMLPGTGLPYHHIDANVKVRPGGLARAGSVSPNGLRMTPSPNSSRSRTPNSAWHSTGFSKLDNGDGYFPLQEKKHAKKLSA